MEQSKPTILPSFTGYQKFVIFILAITQFTVILDFMVMSPLGDMLMKSMDIPTSHFGWAVSAYAFSAGISGLLTAGFADKFDRKKLLLFFYVGFIVGTICCGFANSYPLLLAARIVTGLFGGVIGSISMAIITDIFTMQERGRVMGFVQMGFGASQVLGIPIGLHLAIAWGWNAPFLMVGAIAIIIAMLIITKLQPLTKHLAVKQDRSAFKHLLHTLAKRNYRIGFMATAFMSIGGFLMMPFGSSFAINNLHVAPNHLERIYFVSGISSLVIMPMIGRFSDKIDKFKIFVFASIWMMVMVVIYTHLSVTPLWLVVILNVLLMMGIMSRMIPSSALTSAMPEMQDRGAYMSISSSLAQISGGIAAAFAGLIVAQKTKTSPLEHYSTLGYLMVAISILSIYLLYRVSVLIKQKNTSVNGVEIKEVVSYE